MRTSRAIALLLISAASSTLACSDQGPAGIEGSYELVSVNGEGLPVVITTATCETRVQQGTLALTDGGYHLKSSGSYRCGPYEWQDDPYESSGQYTLVGRAITLQTSAPGEEDLAGTWDGGDQITFIEDTDRVTFRR